VLPPFKDKLTFLTLVKKKEGGGGENKLEPLLPFIRRKKGKRGGKKGNLFIPKILLKAKRGKKKEVAPIHGRDLKEKGKGGGGEGV